MKKILAALIIMPFLIGCENKIESRNGKINAVVTISPYLQFVKAVGGEKVNVISIIPSSGNPHTFEPTPRQLRSMNYSDIYFKVGGSFEFEKIWLSKFETNWRIVDCAEDISISNDDPHIWLSPANAKKILLNIYEGLVHFDPENENIYHQNYLSYNKQLDLLDTEISKNLSEIKNKNFLVYHSAWLYFAKQFRLNEAAIEAEGKHPNAADLAETINFAKSNNIKAIFVDPKYQTDNAVTIAKQIGAEVVQLDPLNENYIDNLISFSQLLRKYSE